MEHGINWTLTRIGKTALTFAAAAIGAAILMGSSCNLTDKAPTVPVISGPSSGVVGVPVTFKATATDPDGDSVAFGFNCSDSTGPAWTGFVASGETLSVSRTFPDSGTFTVRVKAKDLKGKTSDWCSPESLQVSNVGGEYPDSACTRISTPRRAHWVTVSPDGQFLYVSHDENNTVSVVRLADDSVLGQVVTGGGAMHSVMSPDGDYLYVANEMDTSVSAVRCADRTVRHTYVHGTPTDVSIAPGGDYLLVPVPARDRLLKVRTSDMSLSDSISEAGVTRVAVSPDGGHAFVLRPIDMSLDVVKLPDMVVEATIPLDSFPEDVVVCGTGDTLCVLDAGGRVISIVDVGQRAVVNQVVLNQLSKYVAMLPGTSCLIASFGQIGAYYIDVQHGVLVDSATSDGFHFAYGVTANPTGTRVYIANEDGIVVFGKR